MWFSSALRPLRHVLPLPRFLSRPSSLQLARRSLCADAAENRRWDIDDDFKFVLHFTEEDFERFPSERAAFRHEQRLNPETLPSLDNNTQLDWTAVAYGLPSVLRIGDLFTEPYKELLIDRLTETRDLCLSFGLPPLEDNDTSKPLHNNLVTPKGGSYQTMLMQTYWLSLHIWMFHSKQYTLQKDEGVFGSALCALITRRIFEWEWNQIRGWMKDLDVPAFSLKHEVEDMQQYVFGLCKALDEAFEEEAGELGSAKALALDDGLLEPGRIGLGPRVKYILWANVYSGNIDHDSRFLYELSVYILRQRMAMEALPRGTFFNCDFDWAEFAPVLTDNSLDSASAIRH